MNEPDDSILITRYLQGDAVAFDLLYQRHRLPLFNYIVRQVKVSNVADDLFQDVWMKIIRSLDSFQDQSNFTGWAFRIAHNRLVDYWRQHRPEHADELNPETNDSVLPLETLQFLKDCVERLKQLIGLLQADQRDAFLLQQESGLSLEQIAQVTTSTRETVKSRLRYALQKLRNGLQGCEDQG